MRDLPLPILYAFKHRDFKVDVLAVSQVHTFAPTDRRKDVAFLINEAPSNIPGDPLSVVEDLGG